MTQDAKATPVCYMLKFMKRLPTRRIRDFMEDLCQMGYDIDDPQTLDKDFLVKTMLIRAENHKFSAVAIDQEGRGYLPFIDCPDSIVFYIKPPVAPGLIVAADFAASVGRFLAGQDAPSPSLRTSFENARAHRIERDMMDLLFRFNKNKIPLAMPFSSKDCCETTRDQHLQFYVFDMPGWERNAPDSQPGCGPDSTQLPDLDNGLIALLGPGL
jgi:hypothetical protein